MGEYSTWATCSVLALSTFFNRFASFSSFDIARGESYTLLLVRPFFYNEQYQYTINSPAQLAHIKQCCQVISQFDIHLKPSQCTIKP